MPPASHVSMNTAIPSWYQRGAYRRGLVKAEYLTSHGAPDWMAGVSRRLPWLETTFLGRDKFQHFRHWMRHELADYVRQTALHDDAGTLRDWFDLRRLQGMVDEHVAGTANYTDELDKVMTVAVLNRTMRSAVPLTAPDTCSYRELAPAASAQH